VCFLWDRSGINLGFEVSRCRVVRISVMLVYQLTVGNVIFRFHTTLLQRPDLLYMIWYDMIYIYHMIRYDTIWYDIYIWYDTIYGMIWYIWYDTIYVMIWYMYNMVWYIYNIRYDMMCMRYIYVTIYDTVWHDVW
jgi:hypothetical protein